MFQEVIARLTGHIEVGDTSFTDELANWVRRAAAGVAAMAQEIWVDGVALSSVRAVGG